MSCRNEREYYGDVDKILLAVDCILFGFDGEGLKLLLFKRKVAPFEGAWSLIGSFVLPKENVKDAARRIVSESTGLSDVYLEESATYGLAGRDPGARVVSIAHYALLKLQDENLQFDTKYEAKWFSVDDLPSLILDHEEMIETSLRKLRRKAKNGPIGFELLSTKFTIPTLKKLYDAIYTRELDRRNFRKKILSMGVLEKLEEKDKTSSKKGAYLFQFDRTKYYSLLEKGEVFGL